jgi:hypothetical protein
MRKELGSPTFLGRDTVSTLLKPGGDGFNGPFSAHDTNSKVSWCEWCTAVERPMLHDAEAHVNMSPLITKF